MPGFNAGFDPSEMLISEFNQKMKKWPEIQLRHNELFSFWNPLYNSPGNEVI